MAQSLDRFSQMENVLHIIYQFNDLYNIQHQYEGGDLTENAIEWIVEIEHQNRPIYSVILILFALVGAFIWLILFRGRLAL